MHRWVAWQTEDRPDGKPTKVPYSPVNSGKARANDPRTWGRLAEAASEPTGGVDLDTCLSEGTLAAWAWAVVERFGTILKLPHPPLA